MIADLKPYTMTKDSGVPWLGKRPAHWQVRRIKNTARLIMGQAPSSDDCSHERIGLPFLQGCAEFGHDHPKPKQFCRRPAKTSPQGAILMSVRAPVGRLNLADQEYGIGRGLCAIVSDPRLLDTAFAQYSLAATTEGLSVVSTGSTYDAISVGDLGAQPLLLPPLPEQAAIVRFLDYANHRLEKAIRAKRQVIALLNEQKQAIIHRAVTSGLDPNVPLKASGLPWLGDIPKRWDVVRAKYVFHEVDERSTTGSEELLSVSHITGITPRSEKNITMFKASSYVGHKLCRPGDLVINTMWAWMAALGISKHTGIVSSSYGVYRPRHPERIVNDFVDYLLRTRPFVSEYICRSTGIRSSRLRLYPEQFFRILICLPPIEEQVKIAARISVETADLNAAINRTEREIALLREYRTRLIADVVTGKLDVREAARNLPDEAEETANVEEDQIDEPDADSLEDIPADA